MTKARVYLIAIMTLIAGLTYTHVYPCDVVVVSAKASTTGRPFLWKNRDCSANWHQEIKHYPAVTAKAGDYIMVSAFDDAAELNNGDPENPSGGVNAAGFAVSCTSVYEDFNPLHELININTDLIRHALQECATIADWESLLKNFHNTHRGKVISGNFVVIDAKGGAALYECFTGWVISGAWPMDFRKYDANDGRITEFHGGLLMSYTTVVDEGEGDDFIGFFARANANAYIPFNYGEERRERMEYLLTDLANTNRLNYRNSMLEINKDVYGQQVDGTGNVLDQDDCQDDYSTTYCISRAATRLSMLVDGVVPGSDPRLSVFWCALGEPSVALFLPYFVHAGEVSPLAWADGLDLDGNWHDLNDTSLLARASNARETFEGLLYETNTGDVLTGMDDRSMNKNELAKIQAWAIPIEEYVFRRCEELLYDMTAHPSYLTPDTLRNFSNYSVQYAYRNYIEADNEAYAWSYSKPWDPLWIGYTRGGFDDDSVIPLADVSGSSGDSLLGSLLDLFGI